MKISDIIVGTAWPIHPASLAYALDLRIYYIKNKVDDKCFTKNFLFIIYIPLFIKEKCWKNFSIYYFEYYLSIRILIILYNFWEISKKGNNLISY